MVHMVPMVLVIHMPCMFPMAPMAPMGPMALVAHMVPMVLMFPIAPEVPIAHMVPVVRMTPMVHMVVWPRWLLWFLCPLSARTDLAEYCVGFVNFHMSPAPVLGHVSRCVRRQGGILNPLVWVVA